MYNSLIINKTSGLESYIEDLNNRFSNLLFKNIEGYKAQYLGLARLDINGIPMTRDGYEYIDSLTDDNYHLTSCFIESADREDIPGGFSAQLDLLVSVDMEKFAGYKEEGIIQAVRDVMNVTPFKYKNTARDFSALNGITYEGKIPDSLYPFFIFRIKTSLTGIYK